jgi:CheY-like chemotaxis protein
MKLHSGHIGVRSDGINCGSTFYIDIPIHKKVPIAKKNEISTPEKFHLNLRSKLQPTFSEIEKGQCKLYADSLSNHSSYDQPLCNTMSTVVDHFQDIPCIDDSQVTSSTSFDSAEEAPQHSRSPLDVASINRIQALIDDDRALKRSMSKSLVLESLSMVKLSRPPSGLSSPTTRSTPASSSSSSTNFTQRELKAKNVTADLSLASPSENTPKSQASPLPPPLSLPFCNEHRLLIVDDSSVNRKMLRRALKELFSVIDEAVDGKECLERLHIVPTTVSDTTNNGIQYKNENNDSTIQYDIIIMDYWMPEMTGLEATKAIRGCGYNGKIIGLTGNTEQTMKTAFEESGVNMVLTKPYQGEHMITLFQSKLRNNFAFLEISNFSFFLFENRFIT